MKTFKKVLASALAAAMVVTAFPVTNAEAASTAKLNKTKATLYVGQTTTLKVTTPSNWKSVKVTASSNKNSVAKKTKVSGKKVTVKAVKAGTAKVTVKVTAKKAGKKVSKTLKATITVKNPALTVKAADVVAVGATEQITATVKPANTKVTYTSDNAEVATVDENGLVTGVKAGEVTITAKAGKTTKTVKMTVKDVILKDVKQTTTTKLVATIAGNTANVKASDIVITNTYSKANFAVKSVSVDSTDKTQVTVETYVAMNDGKDYTVTLADVTKTITATDGKIVAATISPATVIVPTPADADDGSNVNDISVKFTDANGVEIVTVKPQDQTVPSGFSYVEFKVDATNSGYLDGNTLKLYKVGNTAKVTVIAHTGKYNASAVEEGNVTAEATITGVDPTAVTTAGWNVKLGKSGDTASEFKDVKETQVAVKDTDAVAYIQRATSDGKTADAKDYKFESSDNDVMTLSSTTTNVKNTTAVKINPYKAGAAYIIVKDDKGTVVTTLPVTVGAERKATTLTLKKNTFTLSSVSGVDSTFEIEATVKDQYQADYTVDKLSYKLASDPDTAYQDVTTNKFTLTNPGLGKDTTKDASYTYIVKFGDLKTTFVVTVKASDGKAASYALELSADSIDAVIKADATTSAAITAKVCAYDKNGVKVSDGESGVTFALTKDGKEAKDANDASTGDTFAVNNLTSGKQMATGTYLVTATIGSGKDAKTFTKTFEVKNSQPVATASLTKTELDNTTTKLAEILKVVYDGKELASTDFSVVGDAAIDATKNFDKITLTINVGSYKVQQEVTLGKTVVVK